MASSESHRSILAWAPLDQWEMMCVCMCEASQIEEDKGEKHETGLKSYMNVI